MKLKLGTGKGILLLIIITLMPCSLHAQELTNKEIREKMAEAQTYFDEKNYDEAIKILTEIVEKNPERLDQAVELMDKITEIRNQFNKLNEELLIALYEEEDPDKALDIYEKMKELEPNPNEKIDKFLDDIRIAAEVVVNKKKLREIMDRAKIQLDQKNYIEALAIYEEGFDLGRETYVDSAIISDLDEERVTTAIEEIYNSALVYISDERSLVDQISLVQSRINSLPAGSIDGQINNILIQMSALTDRREDFLEKSAVITENLNNIIAINDKAPERYFLDFSSFLIFGRPDSEYFEGLISTTDLFWEDRFVELSESVERLMSNSYESGLSNYRNDNLDNASADFDDTLNYASSSESLYDLIYERIALDGTLELDDYSAHLINRYYGNLVDTRVIARATSSFGKMISQRQSFENYSLEGDLAIDELYAMRQSINADLPIIDEELVLWETIGSSLDWLEPYEPVIEESPNVNVAVRTELNDLKNEMKDINLAILTRLTDQEYERIVSTLDNYKDSFDNNNTLIDGIIDPEVVSYTGDEELISTFPDRALPELVNLGLDITTLISGTEEIINTFTLDAEEGEEDEKIRNFLDKLDLLVPQLSDLSEEVEILENLARNNIFKADGFEDQGDKLLAIVRTIVDSPRPTRESFDRARDSIKDANNAYFQSLSFKENLDLRKRADSEMAALQQALIDGENRLVVQDVRNYINQGKEAYSNRQYSQARVFLDRALNRWQTTNTTEHPEIKRWMELVELALEYDKGRTISREEPLFDEITQFLNNAYSNFINGVNQLSRGEDDKAKEAFDLALDNIASVESFMPNNEVASLLRLKIEQITDPEVFKNSFSQRINAAMDKLYDSSKSTQAEGYNELIDLSKIDANYPGLQNKILTAEYDIMGTRIRPPSRKAREDSERLFNQAKTIADRGIRAEFAQALILLDQAIEYNPENSAAIALKDELQANSGGQPPGPILQQHQERKIRDALTLFEQQNYGLCFVKVLELKDDPETANEPRVLKLEEELKKQGYSR